MCSKNEIKALFLSLAVATVGFAAFADSPEGSKGNPWQIGSPNAADVFAWTNGTGKLVIEGTGKMKDFSDAPWYDCCESIKSVEIAEGVTSIGEFAFSRCTGLESVTIPERVSSIGIGAFDQCTSLSTVTFAAESQLETIGSVAFSDCLKLGSVEIPASVTRIQDSAFGHCSSLSNVTVRATVPPWNDGRTFDECNALVAIYVPYRTGEAYRSADGWKDYAGMIIDGYTLKIPAAKTGYSYVVSNATEELSGVLANGTNSYLVAVGDAVKVHFTLAEGYKWAEDTPPSPLDLGTMTADKTVDEDDLPTIIPPGCKENPWQIGSPNAADVTAWTNGTELVVQGEGSVANLADAIKGWDGIRGGITAVNVASDGILGAAAGAFAGLGDDSASVALTLPDGWQGEFPDKDGNWYGAKVELTAMPLTVRNVAFLQRWPWNGKVDVAFDVTGPACETNVVVTVLTNGTKAANFTAAVTIPESGVLATNLVWNAAGLGEDFKSDAVTIAVTVDATTVAARSEAGTMDLRTNVTLSRYGTAVAGVRYSDTAWGAAAQADVTLGWTNETTGATGVLKPGLTGEDVTEVELPKKDGDYRLTHSAGDFKSFATFTVSGFRGTEGDPWEIGVDEDKTTVLAWTNETGLVAQPMRGTASVAELASISGAIGDPAAFKVISADGSATNEVQMLLGSDGKAYDTLAEVLAANPQPETVRLFEVKGYWVSYDRGGNDGKGEPQPDPADAIPDMATDMFILTVPTNLTANTYVRTNFVFDCWLGWTNGVKVTHLDKAAGVDFCEPGATLALTAQWTRVIVPLAVTNLTHTTVSVTTNGAPVALFATADGCGIYNVQTNADVTIVYRADSGWALDATGKNGTVVLPNVTWSVNDFVPEEALPTVVPVEDIVSVDGAPAVVTGSKPTADGVLIIPAKIGGKTVKGIADKAFQYATWLRELVIEEGPAEIGNAAFDGCTGLAQAKISGSVTNIGQVAFMRCFALERIEFLGDAPAMQRLAKLDYGICWGAHGFTVATVPGKSGWSEDALKSLCAGWQIMTDNHDGTYTCKYDASAVKPRITGVSWLVSGSTLTVSNVKPGLTYTLEKCACLGATWEVVDTKVGGETDTLEFEIPGDTGASAFFRVTVGD